MDRATVTPTGARRAIDMRGRSVTRAVRLAHFFGNGPREWAAVARVLATNVRVSRSLRRLGFPETARRLGLSVAPEPCGIAPTTLSRRAGRLMWVSDRVLWSRPVSSTCLSRALTTQQILSREGVEVDVVIGVSRKPGFEAHAWLESDGRPMSGFAGPGAYTPIARFRATSGSQR